MLKVHVSSTNAVCYLFRSEKVRFASLHYIRDVGHFQAIFLIIWPLDRRFRFKSRARHAWKSRMMSPHSGRCDFTTNKTLPYPCSLDVVSLYTPIPIPIPSTNATDGIHNPIFHLAKQDIMDLLTVTLNSMYFSFNGFQYLSYSGHPVHGQTRNHCPLFTFIHKSLQEICGWQ